MSKFPLTVFILVAIVLTALYLRRLRRAGKPLIGPKGLGANAGGHERVFDPGPMPGRRAGFDWGFGLGQRIGRWITPPKATPPIIGGQ